MQIVSIYTIVFESDKRYYVYNSRINFFSEIGEELYLALKNSDLSSLSEDDICELKEKEIVVDSADKYDFYYSELVKFNAMNNDRSTINLVIAPTTACNFDCPYCFESKRNPKTMTDEVINKIAEFVKSETRCKYVTLTWYGGEPLIAFDKIKRIYEALSQEDMPKIGSQTVITNGYCFTDEIIDFFREKGCESIQITIDGMDDIHNATRCLKGSDKPTLPRILENVDSLVKKLPKTRLNIRVNINKLNYKEFVKVYKFFHEKYPENQQLNVYPGIIREETADKRTLCNTSFRTSERLELYALLRKEGIDTSDFPKREHRGCMMQHSGSYLIGPEGEFYKCWNDIGEADAIIAHIGDNEITNQSRYVKYSVEATPFNNECRECHAFPICDGGCSYHRYRNMFEDCDFDLCTPYKDIEKLKIALLKKVSL